MLAGGTFIKGLFSLMWRKTILITALLLWLCALPIQAEWVDCVTKQITPIEGTGDGGSMACAQVIPQSDEGNFPLYVEFYDLAQDLWLEVKCEGNTLVSTALSSREGIASARILLENPATTQSLEFSFFDQPGGEPIYQSVAVVLGFSKNLTFNDFI